MTQEEITFIQALNAGLTAANQRADTLVNQVNNLLNQLALAQGADRQNLLNQLGQFGLTLQGLHQAQDELPAQVAAAVTAAIQAGGQQGHGQQQHAAPQQGGNGRTVRFALAVLGILAVLFAGFAGLKWLGVGNGSSSASVDTIVEVK